MRTFRQYITEEFKIPNFKKFDKETMCMRWKKKRGTIFVGLSDSDFINNERLEDEYGNEMGKPKQGIEAKKFPCWQSNHRTINTDDNTSFFGTDDADSQEVFIEREKILNQIAKKFKIDIDIPQESRTYNLKKATVDDARKIGESLQIMTDLFPDLSKYIKKINSFERDLYIEGTNVQELTDLERSINSLRSSLYNERTEKYFKEQIETAINDIKKLSPKFVSSASLSPIDIFNSFGFSVKFDENDNAISSSRNEQDSKMLQKLLKKYKLDKNFLTAPVENLDDLKSQKNLCKFIQAYSLYRQKKTIRELIDEYNTKFDKSFDVIKQCNYEAYFNGDNKKITIVNQHIIEHSNSNGFGSCGNQFDGDTGRTLVDTINHEIGHAISDILKINRYNGTSYSVIGSGKYNTYVPASNDEDVLALYQIYDKMKQADNENNKDPKTNLLSVYGMVNQDEMIAEAIAHFARYREKSKPYVKAIIKHINNLCKKKDIKFNIDESELEYNGDIENSNDVKSNLVSTAKEKTLSSVLDFFEFYDNIDKDAIEKAYSEQLAKEDSDTLSFISGFNGENDDEIKEYVQNFCEQYIEKNREKDAIKSIFKCIKDNDFENISKDDLSLLLHDIKEKAPGILSGWAYEETNPKIFYGTIKELIKKLKSGEEIEDYFDTVYDIQDKLIEQD